MLWRSDKQHFPYNCLRLSDEDNSVSRTDNFVNVDVFNSVTSSRVLSYRKIMATLQKQKNKYSLCLQCRPSWVTAPAQFYQVTFLAPKYHSLNGILYLSSCFLPITESVMLGTRFIPESVFYTQSVMLSPRFISDSPYQFIPSP